MPVNSIAEMRNISFNFAGTCINPEICIILVYPAAYLKTI